MSDQAALGRWLTLSHWCDDTLGTQIVQQINEQMIKWCEAFLDEGHATWAMPGREKGLYGAWKATGRRTNGRPVASQTAARKIARLPDYPEDALLESLDALGIPAELRQDYLSFQLTALPGWAGFIKWRGEERDYPWQQAYPVGLVKFLAIRLWYARELVQKACREELGIEGRYEAVTAYMRDHPEEYYLAAAAGGRPVARPLCRGSRSARASERATAGTMCSNGTVRKSFPRQQAAARRGAAKRLLALARCIGHRRDRTR